MEFYKTEVTITSIRDTVSIPNGMEFYQNPIPLWVYRKSFNSQRDGILRSCGCYCFCFKESFNSQRDGILLKACHFSRSVIGFQFPTGWNFTIDYIKKTTDRHCFNSQRDGILLYLRIDLAKGISVSIPNGMEFYADEAHSKADLACFNSQRDGILHGMRIDSFEIEMGFNSQRDGILP